MPILLLKLKNGDIIKGKFPMHFMLADEMQINFDDIIAVGHISKGRQIWSNRKPH